MPQTKQHLPALDAIPTASDALLTIMEAASFLRASVDLIRREIDDQRLPCVRIGKRAVRIARADIEAYVAARRASAVDPNTPRAKRAKVRRGRS